MRGHSSTRRAGLHRPLALGLWEERRGLGRVAAVCDGGPPELDHDLAALIDSRERIETIPTVGLEAEARVRSSSLSAHSVSPTNTGEGSLMSVQARFESRLARVRDTDAGDQRERELLLTS